ncbi:DUF952 domain-containing protein [Agromyces bauzanensis]
MAGSRIYHVAIEDDWGMSHALGSYEASTRGRSLDTDGYIRACPAERVQAVLDDIYADLELPVVVVVLDEDTLTTSGVPVERPAGAGTGIHVLGAIPSDDPAVVIEVLPATRDHAHGRWLAPNGLEG